MRSGGRPKRNRGQMIQINLDSINAAGTCLGRH